MALGIGQTLLFELRFRRRVLANARSVRFSLVFKVNPRVPLAPVEDRDLVQNSAFWCGLLPILYRVRNSSQRLQELVEPLHRRRVVRAEIVLRPSDDHAPAAPVGPKPWTWRSAFPPPDGVCDARRPIRRGVRRMELVNRRPLRFVLFVPRPVVRSAQPANIEPPLGVVTVVAGVTGLFAHLARLPCQRPVFQSH